jgi:hypothetical protein
VGKAIHYRRSKEIKDMLRTSGDVENWIIEGMRCVVKAPSAMNMQPVIFTASDDMVSAKVRGKRAMEFFDLGIAKLHFEIGAGEANGILATERFFSHRRNNIKP